MAIVEYDVSNKQFTGNDRYPSSGEVAWIPARSRLISHADIVVLENATCDVHHREAHRFALGAAETETSNKDSEAVRSTK